jgi:hypothetical protein
MHAGGPKTFNLTDALLDQAKHRSKKGVTGRYKYAKRGSTFPLGEGVPGDAVGIKGLAKEQPAIALNERFAMFKERIQASRSPCWHVCFDMARASQMNDRKDLRPFHL